MKRFNTTTTGYRFDKCLFWGALGIIVLILFMFVSVYGIQHHPYINCKTEQCENPFYNSNNYECKYVMGIKDCTIQQEGWMNQKILKKGEYGHKPINSTLMLFVFLIPILLTFIINHFAWNKDKSFHLNCFDYIEKEEKKEK